MSAPSNRYRLILILAVSGSHSDAARCILRASSGLATEIGHFVVAMRSAAFFYQRMTSDWATLQDVELFKAARAHSLALVVRFIGGR